MALWITDWREARIGAEKPVNSYLSHDCEKVKVGEKVVQFER